MSRTPLLLAGSVLLALVLGGCASTVDRAASGSPLAPSSAAGDTTVAPSPTPGIRIWGGVAVSFPYGSFAEWVRDTERGGGGVALVRIVEVSDVRWSTASGQGPGPADIARANQGQVEFTIGRLVTVELDRMLRGTWPVDGPTALYWLPGGQIGLDMAPDSYDLPDPQAGSLAVASTWSGADLDATGGVIWLNVDRLFPADASGRVRTFNPDETIMISEIDRYLPAP